MFGILQVRDNEWILRDVYNNLNSTYEICNCLNDEIDYVPGIEGNNPFVGMEYIIIDIDSLFFDSDGNLTELNVWLIDENEVIDIMDEKVQFYMNIDKIKIDIENDKVIRID
jgi:hypothetical protein